MFVVTGVTGQVGAAVADHLLAAGAPVRVVLRRPDAADSWQAKGCKVAEADYSDVAALSAAFESATSVFVLLPPVFDPPPGFPEARRFVDSLHTALEAAKPKHVVVLSSIGAESDRPNLLNALGLLERGLADLPMPVCCLRPAWFIENAAWDMDDAHKGVIKSYLQPLDRPVPMVAVDDVGRTAAALMLAGWTETTVVELEAPQRVSPNQLAAAFERALGHPVRAEAVPRDEWSAIFRAQGMQNPEPRMQMVDGFNAGWIDFAGKGADSRKGRVGVETAIEALVRGRQNNGFKVQWPPHSTRLLPVKR